VIEYKQIKAWYPETRKREWRRPNGKHGAWVHEHARIDNEFLCIGQNAVLRRGHFKGGTFDGGHFEGGTYEGGAFYGGHFRGGLFHAGTFYDGLFEGGRFYDGLYKGGRFCGGDFRGGTFYGGSFAVGYVDCGVFYSGEWTRSPLLIRGGTYPLYECSNGWFQLGCLHMTPAHFHDQKRHLAAKYEITRTEMSAYNDAVRFLEKHWKRYPVVGRVCATKKQLDRALIDEQKAVQKAASKAAGRSR
jgi:hypothetical protein